MPKSKASVKEKRYRFVSDDDGHIYLIGEDERDSFDKWVEAAPYWEDYDGPDFEGQAIGGSYSQYTFTDPRVK